MGREVVLLLLYLSISSQVRRLSSSSISAPLRAEQGNTESAAARNEKLDPEDAHKIHCSRERSRAAWEIIEEYLMSFVEKERYQISTRCRLHPDNDLYRDQERQKFHVQLNVWQCGYCNKDFYEEKYLDQHFEKRHHDLLNASRSRCLADICGALHCDLVMGSQPQKTKCNPAAAARNKHLCEHDNEGPSASRLHEFFLRQFCDSHSCVGSQKPFSKGGKKKRSLLYYAFAILLLMLLLLFYTFIYLYQRGIKRSTQGLKRISEIIQKKKHP